MQDARVDTYVEATSINIANDSNSVKDNVIECPLCGNELQILNNSSEDINVQLSKHMDRCSRSTRRSTGSRSTDASNNSSSAYHDINDNYDSDRGKYQESSDEEMFPDLKARKRRNKRNISSTTRSSSRNSSSTSDINTDNESYTKNTRMKRDSNINSHSNIDNNDNNGDSDTDDNDNNRAIRNNILNSNNNSNRKAYNEKVEIDKQIIHDDWVDEKYMARLTDSSITTDYPIIDDEGTGYKLYKNTWELLHEYQKEGIKWMHGLYRDRVGGILGDEMGLGKTIQLCSHFGNLGRIVKDPTISHSSSSAGAPVSQSMPPPMLQQQRAAMFLIVCPATLLHHWLREMNRWEPSMRVVVLHSVSKTACELRHFGEQGLELILRKIQRQEMTHALTVLMTYDGVKRHKDSLLLIEWTGVALDEGQKIRNPHSEISCVCKLLPTYHRMILSGTPIQNNLQELWNLFDFIYPSRLGTLVAFELEFALPIRSGGYANASRMQKEIAVQTAIILQRIVKPYLLRRKKDDLLLAIKMPLKTEHVLFCNLTKLQRSLYMDILNSSEVAAVLANRMTSFRAIMTLRKLCNHPTLSYHHGKIKWSVAKGSATAVKSGRRRDKCRSISDADGDDNQCSSNSDGYDDDSDDDDAADGDAVGSARSNTYTTTTTDKPSIAINFAESGKLQVLAKILPMWQKQGHKVILFSQTQSMLNILEAMMKDFQFRYLRLDGSTPVYRRSAIIDTYNRDTTVYCMLLTTRTGGLGISLTGADRVILVDPDWNPQTDIQARERAWRLGQQRDVTIYRLITRGTIEEKIYQRQIFKLLLSNRILDKAKQKTLFAKTNVRDLFQLTDVDRYNDGTTDLHLPRDGQLDLTAVPINASTTTTATARSTGTTTTSSSSSSSSSKKAIAVSATVDALEEGELVEGLTDATDSTRRGDFSSIFECTPPTVTNTDATQVVVVADAEVEVDIDDNISEFDVDFEILDAATYTEQMLANQFSGYTTDADADTPSITAYDDDDDDDDATIFMPPAASTSVKTVVPTAGVVAGTDACPDERRADDSGDKDILAALLNGSCISGVYDHNYFEPGVSEVAIKHIQERAQRTVNEAYRNLQHSSNGNAYMPPPSVSVTTSFNGNTYHSSTIGRFGQQRCDEAATSSSALLGTLRSIDTDHMGGVGENRRMYHMYNSATTATTTGGSNDLLSSLISHISNKTKPANTSSSSTSSSSGNGRGNGNRNTVKAVKSSGSLSIRESMRTRLIDLFSRAPKKPYRTDFLLQKFSDVDDKFASIFREELRSIARLDNDRWMMK